MPTDYDRWRTNPDTNQLEREMLTTLCEQATDALRDRACSVMMRLRQMAIEYESMTQGCQSPSIETALGALTDEFGRQQPR